MAGFRKIIVWFVLATGFPALAQNPDTLFFESLKRFFYQQTGYTLNKKLFTQWAKNASTPFSYIYVSQPNKVSNVLKENFIYTGDDSLKAAVTFKSYSDSGYSVFHYRTFGTSDARITKNLLAYAGESKAFLVFHELTHNYFSEKKIKLNYSLNEAVCDMLGVQFAARLVAENKLLRKKKVERSQAILESIYRIINETTEKINADTLQYKKYSIKAQESIKKKLKKADRFFYDRFSYPVNTAYLLKNSYYGKYYFTVTQLYQKSKNFDEFISQLITLSNTLP